MEKDKDLITLGDNIRIERAKQKLTQEQLVERAETINAQHLGKIEKGEVDMRISTLFSILRALNCRLEDLIDLNGDK